MASRSYSSAQLAAGALTLMLAGGGVGALVVRSGQTATDRGPATAPSIGLPGHAADPGSVTPPAGASDLGSAASQALVAPAELTQLAVADPSVQGDPAPPVLQDQPLAAPPVLKDQPLAAPPQVEGPLAPPPLVQGPPPATPAQPPVAAPAPLDQPAAVAISYAPPPPLEESQPPAPSEGAVWVAGYWDWDGDWVWSAGRWETPPQPAYSFTPAFYEERGPVVIYVPGHWRPANTVFVPPKPASRIAAVVLQRGTPMPGQVFGQGDRPAAARATGAGPSPNPCAHPAAAAHGACPGLAASAPGPDRATTPLTAG